MLVLVLAHPEVRQVVEAEWLDDGAREELPGAPDCARVSLSQTDTDAVPGTEVLQAGVLVAGVAREGVGGGGEAGVAGGHVGPRHVEPLRVSRPQPSLTGQQVSWANIWLVALHWDTDCKLE